MKPILSRRQWRLAVVVAVIVVGLGFALLARHNQQKRDRQFSGSCANHSSQLKLLISTFMSEADRFPLETNARIAFMIMSQTDPQTQSWLSTAGAACPESFRRNKSIGYVFVADGQATKTVAESSALILFCPADSHQRSDQHCHAVIGGGERMCLKSNQEMMDLLQAELERARNGIVPYSSNAVARMTSELKARAARMHQ